MKKTLLIPAFILTGLALLSGCSEAQTQAVRDFQTTGRAAQTYSVDQFRTYKAYDDVVGKGLILTLAPLGVTNSRPVVRAGTAPAEFVARHNRAAVLHAQATGRGNCTIINQGEIAFGQFVHKVQC